MKPNYKGDKRRKEAARKKKQEEKRNRRLNKQAEPPQPDVPSAREGSAAETKEE